MANYYILLTDYGKQVIANAHTATPIQLINVVLGDANNQPYIPESRLDQTALVHETARVPVTRVKVVNSTTAEVTALVPSNIGGFNIHEIGIVDVMGKLVYVGNFHGGYRPLLTEGAGGDMEFVFSITANNIGEVIIETDPTVVTASKAWVNSTISKEFADFQALFEIWQQSVNTDLETVKNRKIEPVSVGGLLVTTRNYANSQEVHDGEGYGVWARYGEEQVLAGYSERTNAANQFKTMGTVFDIGGDTGQSAIVVQFWLRLPDNYVAPTFNLYFSSDANGDTPINTVNEGEGFYLWVDANNLTLPVNIGDLLIQYAGTQLNLNKTELTLPQTISQGKTLLAHIAAEQWSVDNSGNPAQFTMGFSYIDTYVDMKKDVATSMTMNDNQVPVKPPMDYTGIKFNVLAVNNNGSWEYVPEVIENNSPLTVTTESPTVVKNALAIFNIPNYLTNVLTTDLTIEQSPINDNYTFAKSRYDPAEHHLTILSNDLSTLNVTSGTIVNVIKLAYIPQ